MTLLLESSRTCRVSPEAAYDAVLPMPLTDLFHRRYGVIPPISRIEGQVGEWGSALGQTRTIRLADGGRFFETLTSLERPGSFGYSLAEVRGPLRPLVRSVEGRWTFAPDPVGCRITWSWRVGLRSRLAVPLTPVLRHQWNGYAALALAEIERRLGA